MWSLIIGMAFAGDATDGVTWAFGQVPTPEVVLSCAPLAPVLELVRKIPLPAAVTATDKEQVRLLQSLLDPVEATRAGFDPTGAAVVAFREVAGSDGNLLLALPFTGSREQAATFLRAFMPTPPTETATGWESTGKSGEPIVASLANHRLVLSDFPAGAPGGVVSKPLVDGLPTSPGCVAYLTVDTDSGKMPAHFVASGFLPLGTGVPATVRVASAVPAPAAFAHAEVVPTVGSSTAKPTGVVVLGATLDTLLSAAPKVSASAADGLAKIRDVARFDGGAAVAFFGNPTQMNFAAAVPIANAHGHPISKARLMKGVKGAGATRTSRTTFDLTSGKKTFHGAVGRGLLVIGSDATVVAEAAAGKGTKWITPELAAFAQDWPLAMDVAGVPGAEVQAGVHARDGMWEATFAMTGDGSAGAMPSVIGMLSKMAIPKLDAMEKKAKSTEVLANIARIRAAELAYDAAFDGYLALPVAPRPVASLDAKPFAWGSQPAWDTVGFSPDGPVRATYWVELGADGRTFTVHAMADLDGDGVPAHYTENDAGGVTTLTDPSIQ